MQYQTIINLLDNHYSPSRFKTKNWVNINEDRRGAYDKKILSLRLQCWTQFYVVIVMHIYLLKEK